MSLTTHTLTLTVNDPDRSDDPTPLDGKWRVWLEVNLPGGHGHALALDDTGTGIGGEAVKETVNGTATFQLVDTEQAGFEPQGAYYKAYFSSTNRSTRFPTEPFLMDGDKNLADILITSREPVTPSLLAETEDARDAARAALAALVTGIESGDFTGATGPQGPTGSTGPAGSDATVTDDAVADKVTNGTTTKAALDKTYAGTVLLTKYATADGTDQTTQVQAAVDALASGASLEVPAGTKFRVDGQVNLTKPVTIMSRGRGGFTSSVGTTGQTMFSVTSSDVHFRGVTITGPQFATNAEQFAINFAGTDGTTPLDRVSVRDCSVNRFGKYGIRALYITNFAFCDNAVYDCGYAGIGVLSGVNGSIDGNRVQNITKPGIYTDAYGIFTSRNQTSDFTVDPRSESISICNNRVFDVPAWDGINTHAGKSHTIANNVIRNCSKPIELVGCVNNTSGNVEYAPLDMTVIGNTIWSKTDGTAGHAITLVGAQGTSTVGTVVENATGLIAFNTIRGGGPQGTSFDGGIRVYYTTGLIVTGNVITEPSPHGILFYHDNYNFTCTENVITDPWSTTLTVAAGIKVNSDYNTGIIDRNTVIRGSRSAAHVLTHGVYLTSGLTNSSVALGRGNRFSAATTEVADGGVMATSVAMAGVDVLTNRPAASSAVLDKWYLATDVLGGTLYYCRNLGGSYAWVQAGTGAIPDDGLWRPRDNGFVGAAVDPSSAATTQTAMVSGTQYVTRVKVDQSGTIAKARFYLQTAGTAITEGTATVYDSSGVQLCNQDITATLGTTGLVTVTFTTPSRTVVVGEVLFVVLRCTFPSGTAPALRGVSTSSFPNGNAITPGPAVRYGTLGTGITSAPASITVSAIVGSSIGAQCHWVGLA